MMSLMKNKILYIVGAHAGQQESQIILDYRRALRCMKLCEAQTNRYHLISVTVSPPRKRLEHSILQFRSKYHIGRCTAVETVHTVPHLSEKRDFVARLTYYRMGD